jgi:hypothetical protein
LVPDCGGPWFKLQSNENTYAKELIRLCLNLTKMVKSHGIIQFSKFLYESMPCTIDGIEFKNLISALQYFLIKEGFVTEIIDVEAGPHIIARRINK